MDTEPRLQSYRGAGRHALYPYLLLLFYIYPRREIPEDVCIKERSNKRNGTSRLYPSSTTDTIERAYGENVFYTILL